MTSMPVEITTIMIVHNGDEDIEENNDGGY
jgi:hypothetical protein